MDEIYELMHKDNVCGVIAIDADDGKVANYKSLSTGEAPFLGNDQASLIKKWWVTRCVPATRKAMQEVIRRAGCETNEEYLAKNLALSMTDCYWIRPIDTNLKWGNVKLWVSGNRMGGKVPYHNDSSYDPNASLSGQMEKYWDLSEEPPVLVKTSGMYYGQQALNEMFASEIHREQGKFPFVDYEVRVTENGDMQVVCHAFTSETREFVPALEVVESQKRAGDESLYDMYIRVCAKNGIDEGYMHDYMDYQTLTDFIISNTDEHLLNFGILRDPDTLRFTGPAPIFDSGNSMFYSETRRRPFERYELLERKITSFHDTEEAMLKHVTNRMVVNEDLLPGRRDVFEFYAENGVPEDKAGFISNSYANKLKLLKEFQRGKTISLYREKIRKRQEIGR